MLKREIQFAPAYDKSNADPKKDYGIHGVNMRWILKGPKGAIQFLVFTNWHLPHVTEDLLSRPIRDRIDAKVMFLPLPADIGYHSPKPMYEGQQPMDNECEVLGSTCYYDGSGLRANDVFNLLVEQGGEAVWKYMEEEYQTRFEEVCK